MKLRKCICGGKPKHYPLDYDDVYNDELSHIECSDCGLTTLSHWNGNKAMQMWNRLQREKLVKTRKRFINN